MTAHEIKSNVLATVKEMTRAKTRLVQELEQMVIDEIPADQLREMYAPGLLENFQFAVWLDKTAGKYEDEELDCAIIEFKDLVERCLKIVA